MCATIGGMGVRDVGLYIADCIRKNGMTVACVTASAGVKPNYVWRLKNERIKNPKVHTLRALTDAAQGAWEVVSELLDGKNEPPPDSRQALREMADTLTDDELPEAIDAVRRVRASRRQRKKPRASRNDDA